MRKITTNVKWTRGRSTVERATKGTKVNWAMKQKVLHMPFKLFNSILSKKAR
jgi:hypothetical protein